MIWTPSAWTELRNNGWPPEITCGPPSGATIPASIGRTDRIGPTTSGRWEWKTALKRVIPPSTISSHTTSASSRPVWGRAIAVFSTLTASAGPSPAASPSGSPVSGHVGSGVGSGSGVGVSVTVGVATTVGSAASRGTVEVHAPSASTVIVSAATHRRRPDIDPPASRPRDTVPAPATYPDGLRSLHVRPAAGLPGGTGREAVAALLAALPGALDGSAPAVHPVDPGAALPPGPAVPPGVAAVVRTS